MNFEELTGCYQDTGSNKTCTICHLIMSSIQQGPLISTFFPHYKVTLNNSLISTAVHGKINLKPSETAQSTIICITKAMFVLSSIHLFFFNHLYPRTCWIYKEKGILIAS